MTARVHSLSARTVVVLAAIAFVVGLAIGTDPPADAHSGSAFFPGTWEADPYYKFGQLEAPLDTTSAKSSLHASDDPWNSVSDSWLDFQQSAGENPHVQWQGSACATAPSNGVWILTDDLPNTAIARENTCYDEDPTIIIKSTIRFDHVGPSWYTGASSSVPSGDKDLRSVAVHEFGHAAGFNGHFTGPSVCKGSTRQTMCPGPLQSGTSYRRTLGNHDAHTIAAAY